MNQRKPPEFIIEVFADPSSVKDVVRGILHTIFFQRYFPSIRPKTREVLDLTLPFVDDVELETLIDQRTETLMRQLDTSCDLESRNGGVRGIISVKFFEKKRKKAWFTKGEDEVCWERWILDVTLATPRNESERSKVRKAMEQMLLKAAMKIVSTVNLQKDHIPPITSGESNPFPYQIEIEIETFIYTSTGNYLFESELDFEVEVEVNLNRNMKSWNIKIFVFRKVN